jgi:hypothetical protein
VRHEKNTVVSSLCVGWVVYIIVGAGREGTIVLVLRCVTVVYLGLWLCTPKENNSLTIPVRQTCIG